MLLRNYSNPGKELKKVLHNPLTLRSQSLMSTNTPNENRRGSPGRVFRTWVFAIMGNRVW
jgi:hypothetical protein